VVLGKCPYCNDGKIEVRDKEVRGKKVKLYACSNAYWKSEDGEMYELTEQSTCDFKIWQNTLAKYGRWLQYKDIRTLLLGEELELEFLSKRYGNKVYYSKFVVLNREYGVNILWD